jgi:hypothetical protein
MNHVSVHQHTGETDDKAAVAQGLSELLRRVPRDARLYKVTPDANRIPPDEAAQKIAQRSVMIQITLSDAR